MLFRLAPPVFVGLLFLLSACEPRALVEKPLPTPSPESPSTAELPEPSGEGVIPTRESLVAGTPARVEAIEARQDRVTRAMDAVEAALAALDAAPSDPASTEELRELRQRAAELAAEAGELRAAAAEIRERGEQLRSLIPAGESP